MSVLLKEIRRIDPGAARVLEEAKFYSDSEIHTLTREDLHELFPGVHKLKLRRDIFETIHKQKPIQILLTELQAFIPQEALRAALTSHGVLVDYLHILKDMKTQLNNVQSFLDAHVEFLENLSKDGLEQQQGQGSFGSGHSDIQKQNISGAPTGSATDGWETLDRTNCTYGQSKPSSEKPQTSGSTGGFLSIFGFNRTENTAVKVTQNIGRPYERSRFDTTPHVGSRFDTNPHVGSRFDTNPHVGSRFDTTPHVGSRFDTTPHVGSRFDTTPQRHQVTVNYKMVISGKTFDAHVQILGRIRSSTQQLNLVNVDLASKDCHVTFVFCPVVSRVGTDVDAAMKEVEGSGPVILVLMHHSHVAKHVASFKTWGNGSDKDIDCQNVFYHEKSNGLISCKENEDAISAIRNNLVNHFEVVKISLK